MNSKINEIFEYFIIMINNLKEMVDDEEDNTYLSGQLSAYNEFLYNMENYLIVNNLLELNIFKEFKSKINNLKEMVDDEEDNTYLSGQLSAYNEILYEIDKIIKYSN